MFVGHSTHAFCYTRLYLSSCEDFVLKKNWLPNTSNPLPRDITESNKFNTITYCISIKAIVRTHVPGVTMYVG